MVSAPVHFNPAGEELSAASTARPGSITRRAGRHATAVRALGLAVTFVCSALAQPNPAAELLDAVAKAPALDAARQRIEAARSRIESSGRLADPEVEAMMLRANPAAEASRDMWELNVRQPLPRRGERAADRERARAVVSVAEADYAAVAGEIAADVASSLAELRGAESRLQLLEEQLGRLGAVLRSLDARLAAGATVRLADRLTVQTRIAALQLTAEEARRAAADAAAAARARLALSVEMPLPDFAAPAAEDIAPDEAAALLVAGARAAEADAQRKVALASMRPATAIGLRYERERTNAGNGDTVGLAFSADIPYRSRHYARAEVRAAGAERAAALADATAARHQVTSAVSRAERAERLAGVARRLAAETQARLEAEHAALSRAASAAGPTPGMPGDSAVLHAVDILDKATETQLQIIDAETAARTARAELWRYAPSRLLATTLNRQSSTPN